MTDTTPLVAPGRAASQPARFPQRFGVHVTSGGADVVVHAPNASAVYLCVFDGPTAQHPARERTADRVGLLPGAHGTWTAHVPGLGAGTIYGFRIEGKYDRQAGMAFNPAKVLLDPYARGVLGEFSGAPETYPGTDAPDPRDSAAHVPLGVILDPVPQLTIDAGERPHTPWANTVIYEAHVRGLTMRLPGVPDHLRGTYAGLAHPETLAHLRRLGITAIQLLPLHAKATEPSVQDRGGTNYWGYNTLGFFAPEPSYATAKAQESGPAAVRDEIRGMVHLLHEAGLEVLVDVVYNHTCEGGVDGPMLSWRGFDEAGYYLRSPDGSHYRDMTGTGNSLDFRNPRVVQMTLDSLRYWVEDIGVDGFRFDLTVTLGREGSRFTPRHPFLTALTTDPVLAHVKLIAEPWDLGPDGWQTGTFPAPFSEWNDRFRDSVRTFWVADRGGMTAGAAGGDLRELATRLAGSADMFSHGPLPRGPVSSINFLTAHDGFTLVDLVSYDRKHNEENGEENRDGSDNSRSWNHGEEGPTTDPQVQAARERSVRNLIGTLMISAGVPMITGGDEFGRTQHGNNNMYCHDDERAWLSWDIDEQGEDTLATFSHLLQLRATHPALRPDHYRFLTASGRPTLAWFDEHGEEMAHDVWHDPHYRVLQMTRASGNAEDSELLVVINGALNAVTVTAPSGASPRYQLVWDSSWTRPQIGTPTPEDGYLGAAEETRVPGMSLRIYLSAPD